MIIKKECSCGKIFEIDSQYYQTLTCSKECERKYRNQYRKNYMNNYWKNNSDKYNKNKLNNRQKAKIKKELYKGAKVYILDFNDKQLDTICDECYTKFYYDYKLTESMNIIEGIHIFKLNSTSWGASICPICGLIGKYPSIEYDTLDNYQNYTIPSRDELNKILELSEQSWGPPTTKKKQAIYLDTKQTRIDFLSEAQIIRRKRNSIRFEKIELTSDEETICINMMLHNINY